MTDRSRACLVFLSVVVTCFVAGSPAYPQTYYQEHEIQVANLPWVVSRTHDQSDVLFASLTSVFHDPEICCGRDSALEDSAQAADGRSLRDMAAKLAGRHLLGDGRPIHVTAEYVSPEAATASRIISEITNQHPLLMQWNSHFYVVYGVDYVRTEHLPDGAIILVIRKFLLWDTRYSDDCRNVIFDRETEDTAKVKGMLFLQWRMD